jgi:hypothetical protein
MYWFRYMYICTCTCMYMYMYVCIVINVNICTKVQEILMNLGCIYAADYIPLSYYCSLASTTINNTSHTDRRYHFLRDVFYLLYLV